MFAPPNLDSQQNRSRLPSAFQYPTVTLAHVDRSLDHHRRDLAAAPDAARTHLLLALIFIAVAGFVYRWIESAPAGPGAPPSPIGGMVLSLSSLLVSLATLGFVRYQAAIAMRQMEQLERADANTRELILAFSLDSGHVRERAL